MTAFQRSPAPGALRRRWPAAPWALLATLALALMLGGCGPTGGGTGSGESFYGPADFGARPASLCGSALTAQLSCPTGTVTSGSVVPDGTAAVPFVGIGASGAFTLVLQDNRAELRSRCVPTRFDGEWGLAASGEARFFGSYRGADPLAGGGAEQPAVMTVQVVGLPGAGGGASDGLQISVADAQGRLLLGPVQLQRTSALPTTPPRCP